MEKQDIKEITPADLKVNLNYSFDEAKRLHPEFPLSRLASEALQILMNGIQGMLSQTEKNGDGD